MCRNGAPREEKSFGNGSDINSGADNASAQDAAHKAARRDRDRNSTYVILCPAKMHFARAKRIKESRAPVQRDLLNSAYLTRLRKTPSVRRKRFSVIRINLLNVSGTIEAL